MPVVDALLWLLVAVVLLPMAVVVAESLAALLPARRDGADAAAPRPACAVLIPAHDEEAGIGRTLANLGPQLEAGDRVVVVADNCTDRTAEVARRAGATVVERHDRGRRGKGFALDFGVRALDHEPPPVVVVLDADCVVADGGVGRLVRAVTATGRPAQAAYVLEGAPGDGARARLSAFAFLYKNVVRPRGLARLGLPCLLTGTGMAFPWAVLRAARLASGNIVEDMQLGVDVALAGHPATLCPDARVLSELPSGGPAARVQRTRWEHGHLLTLLTQVPRLAGAALRRRRLDLLGLALDLSVPPLSMLLLVWAVVLAGLVGAWGVGASHLPAVVLAAGGPAVLLAVLAAWVKFGRERLPLSSLLAAPFYVLWKVPIYLAFPFLRQRAWVRTERAVPTPADGPADRPG